MKVHFTVDAYPNETFVGEVLQVRLNATMTQNVVTYTVVVTTENKDMKLLPYMTANLLFEIERHEDVLKVPNAALRWKPRPKQIAPEIRAETLAAMNRRDDKPKRPTTRRPKGKRPGSRQPADSGAEQPTQDSKLATSAGTATGLTPKTGRPARKRTPNRRASPPCRRRSRGRNSPAVANRRDSPFRRKPPRRSRNIMNPAASGSSTGISSGRSRSRSSPPTAR